MQEDLARSSEIKTRTDLLNFLADRYGLQSYLEIGVENPKNNFNHIRCEHKVGVDPDIKARATFRMTSDVFFKYVLFNKNNQSPELFDLIFIDGLHTADQVKRDVENSIRCVSSRGFIVLHDCSPQFEAHTIVPRPQYPRYWNGDVYKFASRLTCEKYCVDIDTGCLVIPNVYAQGWHVESNYDEEPNWEYFNEHRNKLLNIISWEEFVKLHT